MDSRKYHVLREAVRRQAPPPPREELPDLGEHYLKQLRELGLFADLDVVTTDDEDQLITATCQFPDDLSPETVASELERLWGEEMRHPFWEAHTISTEPREVALEAATRFGSDGPYVTVKVVAQRMPIPRQRRYGSRI